MQRPSNRRRTSLIDGWADPAIFYRQENVANLQAAARNHDHNGTPMRSPMANESKSKFSIGRTLAIVATIAGALAIIPASKDAISLLSEGITRLGTVDLPNSHPNEEWRVASKTDFGWLEGTWCYESLEGFRAAYEVHDKGLRQRNQPDYPAPEKTEWITADVYASNTGLIQLIYRDADWPSYFIKPLDKMYGSYYGNTRHSLDDGTVVSGTKVHALSCTRCTSEDGTYSCSPQ